jgi:iron uptake system component EfeO
MRSSSCGALAVLAALVLPVAGCGSGEDAPPPRADAAQSKAAAAQYRAFLEKRAAKLLPAAGELRAQIEAGELPEAQTSYAIARIAYGQIEPGVESLFPRLGARIDVRARNGEAPAGERSGLPAIEQGIYTEGSAGTIAAADHLIADVRQLQRRLKDASLPPQRLLEGTRAVLEQASETAAHGGREPHSLLDTVDVAANLEGAQAAFEAARPAIEAADSDLAEEIDAEFHEAFGRLRHFGFTARTDESRTVTAGIGFALYGVRNQAEYGKLGPKIRLPAEGLAEASAALAP